MESGNRGPCRGPRIRFCFYRSRLRHFRHAASNHPKPMNLHLTPFVFPACLRRTKLFGFLPRAAKPLIRRLRDREKFQGARYEVFVAASFARAGFEIELLDDAIKNTKHCEFVATHRHTRTRVFVEAKSRRRRGVLHEPGELDQTHEVHGDILGLYHDAVQQAPEDGVYFIFIDANLPSTPHLHTARSRMLPSDAIPWVKATEEQLKQQWKNSDKHTVETAVIITNFADYYGNEVDPAPAGFLVTIPSPKPRTPLLDRQMLDDLMFCLQNYGTIPKQF